MRRLLILVALLFAFEARAVTIDWVPIGNPGNPAVARSDNCLAPSCGSVGYDFYISKYETTNAQYSEFLNAKAASDPFELYDTRMGSEGNGGITRSGASASYTYAVKAGFAAKPVNFVTFYDALRFANWLNNGQGSAGTETGAYTLLGGTPAPTNGSTVERNAGAITFLTSENEWYKAAYYSPGGVYFHFPTGTDIQTGCVVPASDTGNSANCELVIGPAATDVGAYGLSESPYGTFDQGGNLDEWNESHGAGDRRGRRAGNFFLPGLFIDAELPSANPAGSGAQQIGFRVARVVAACADGADNDGDGFVDMADPGCPFPYATIENPQCDDGIDNDQNGFTDFADSKCQLPSWPYWETPPPCGLGAELVFVLPLLSLVATRRRRAN